MAISSINIQTYKRNGVMHNKRILPIDYAIDNEEKNEYKSFFNIEEYRQKIEADYKNFHNQKMQKKATPIREAVVNLNKHHTMEDLINLKNMLEDKYKIQILDIALHRDEGHIKDGKKIYNYHAHLIFSNYDFSNHRSIKNGKTEMRQMQTDVAKVLQMERGKENSQKKRLTHQQFKQQKKEIEKTLNEKNLEIDLYKYNYKELRKEITSLENAASDEKKSLHKLNSKIKNLNDDNEEKSFLIEQLKNEILKLTNTNVVLQKENEEKNLLIENLKIEIKNKNEKLDFLENRNKQYFGINKDLKNEIEHLKNEIKNLVDIAYYKSENKFHTYKQVADKARKMYLELKKENSNLKKENDQLQNFEYSEAVEAYENISKKYNQLKKNTLVPELENENDNLKNENDQLKKENLKLINAVENLKLQKNDNLINGKQI